MTGLGQLELLDSVPQVPWMAKVDSAGNLLWQYFYYDLSSAGRPISQYLASSTTTSDNGFLALGFTEKNDPTSIGNYTRSKRTIRDSLGSAISNTTPRPSTPSIPR